MVAIDHDLITIRARGSEVYCSKCNLKPTETRHQKPPNQNRQNPLNSANSNLLKCANSHPPPIVKVHPIKSAQRRHENPVKLHLVKHGKCRSPCCKSPSAVFRPPESARVHPSKRAIATNHKATKEREYPPTFTNKGHQPVVKSRKRSLSGMF